MKTHIRTLAVIVSLSLSAIACGGSTAETVTAPTAETATATVAGAQIDLGSLEGQDTVLWFWAPW